VFGVGIGVALAFTAGAWMVRREHARLADGARPAPP
jgi:hypothetical protein